MRKNSAVVRYMRTHNFCSAAHTGSATCLVKQEGKKKRRVRKHTSSQKSGFIEIDIKRKLTVSKANFIKTGEGSNKQRVRAGTIRVAATVGNFSASMPNASSAIMISGIYERTWRCPCENQSRSAIVDDKDSASQKNQQ